MMGDISQTLALTIAPGCRDQERDRKPAIVITAMVTAAVTMITPFTTIVALPSNQLVKSSPGFKQCPNLSNANTLPKA